MVSVVFQDNWRSFSNLAQRTFIKLSPIETAFLLGRNVDPGGKEFLVFSGVSALFWSRLAMGLY